MRRAIGAAALGVFAMLSGCQTSPLPPPPSAVTAYEAHNYEQAYKDAAAEYNRTSGLRRDRAALMAGLSAHALGRYAEAKRWLEPLTHHSDRDISGRASATLGLIDAKEGNNAAAAALLSSAGRKLTGEAAAHANFEAGESYAALGRLAAARLHYQLAAATTTDPELKKLIADRLGMVGYTVQVGAFASRTNAERKAASVRPRAMALGLGEPRIVERVGSGGRRLYLVQIGSYKTEREATTARTRLGGDAVVASAKR